MKDDKTFYEELITSGQHVTLFTINGVQIHGHLIDQYDSFIVFAEDRAEPGRKTRISKAAISTIRDFIDMGSSKVSRA